MKRIFFFATKNDMLAVANFVESDFFLTYVLSHHGLFDRERGDAPRYQSLSEMPMLGVAARQQTGGCERYIVAHRSTPIVPVARSYNGESVTEYEQGNCPDAIELNAGGIWEDRVLISGLIQTWSESMLAQQLMRKFLSAMRNLFKCKINEYWVGMEAYQFLELGGRLTFNADTNSSFDLKIRNC
ncbi:hypothetical protein [Pandoraea sp. ISTKB]|uniref:hypothetical protein n=1 Tax=Pandoraea sp. ISTKB TaxID=1586708 RepID=UPI00084782C1|nr:hypothetical protein [Pandoraea sp. ISTKB]ODP30732.1 hypothetical protein A9762_27715 [Pandoraea sp. ISTKB]